MLLNRLLILNLALLIGHQCDAAYWHEWDMFHLPGGIQLFNVLNVLIFIVLLAWLPAIIQRRRPGYRYAWVIAAICCIVLPIHSGFALAGVAGFELPVSVALIVATFIGGCLQMLVTMKCKGEFIHG